MLIEAFLRRLVVIGGDDQRRVGPWLGGPACQPQRLARAVRAGAGHHLDPAGRDLDHRGDDPFVLFVRQRGRFARRADRAEALRAGRDLKFDLLAQSLDVGLAVLERSGDRHGQAGKRFTFGWHRGKGLGEGGE